ncbi:pyocin knob domain-containing protein [Enterococcus sp. DIV1420a]|uniref:pyocin knob domain-containing protein n=1 Tax=Enterococcus sp. DIV1420a TaxID=2774672 RepID=UPI003F6852DD
MKEWKNEDIITPADAQRWEEGIDALATPTKKGLLSHSDKAKLDTVETGANKYVHPISHPATIITQDATHRFVTDAEKIGWNEKASKDLATTLLNGLMSSNDKAKLDGIEAGAQKNPGLASTVSNGLMNAFDKLKLNGIQAGAQKNPGNATAVTSGLMSSTDKAKLENVYSKTETDSLFADALVAKKELIVAQDWNTIKAPGMYAVNAATGLNRPAGAVAGNLLVQQAGNMNSLTQFFIGNEQLNTRRFDGVNWLAWQTVALEPQQKPLWMGGWYGGGPIIITLSKALSKCRNGIILQWQEYSTTSTVQNTQYSFTYIPKQHLTNGGARGTNCYVGGYGSKEIYGKYLYINDTTITGNDVNAPATVATGVGIKKYVLVKIWEV